MTPITITLTEEDIELSKSLAEREELARLATADLGEASFI
jgi:hypothetical protein